MGSHQFDVGSAMVYMANDEDFRQHHIVPPILPPPTYDEAAYHQSAPTRQQMFHDEQQQLANFKAERRVRMLAAGKAREKFLHRYPHCLMDQMVSGSHYFPIALMPGELTLQEQRQVKQLKALPVIAATGHADHLALDLMSYLVYDIETVIILDNSSSMNLNLFGQQIFADGRVGGFPMQGGFNGNISNQMFMQYPQGFNNQYNSNYMAVPLQTGFFVPSFQYNPNAMNYRRGFTSNDGADQHMRPQDPQQSRWHHAHYTLMEWRSIFQLLHVNVKIITLNPIGGRTEFGLHDLDFIFSQPASGNTPLTEATAQAVTNVLPRNTQSRYQGQNPNCCPYGALNNNPAPPPASNTPRNRHLQILMITDGEANNMDSFNQILDATQNQYYGDVQMCILGLSLQPKDVEWMDNEECEHIRVRTIEAYEIEQFQIAYRLTAYKEGNYNYAMHLVRALLTNLFPGDYDFEAPSQTLRHRFYITMHAKDRWKAQQSALYGIPSFLAGALCTTPLYCATGFCCCGYLQGQDCGRCRPTECLDNFGE